MAGIVITYDVGPAPQGGQASLECSSPASVSAFQTAAATALSTYGGFISVTVESAIDSPANPTGIVQTKLLNLSKIISVDNIGD